MQSKSEAVPFLLEAHAIVIASQFANSLVWSEAYWLALACRMVAESKTTALLLAVVAQLDGCDELTQVLAELSRLSATPKFSLVIGSGGETVNLTDEAREFMETVGPHLIWRESHRRPRVL
jgi:hypothetical protein